MLLKYERIFMIHSKIVSFTFQKNVMSLESIEDGWTVVRSSAFDEKQIGPRVTFLVAWNPLEWGLAITAKYKSRTVDDEADESHSTWLSLHEITCIHQQWTCLKPQLEHLFPVDLPSQPSRLWEYFWGSSGPSVTDAVEDKLPQSIKRYLDIANDTVGHQIVRETLFPAEADIAENERRYFEGLSDLRRSRLLEATNQLRATLVELSATFRGIASPSMRELKENLYDSEDFYIALLLQRLAETFSLQLQPFVDLRELAYHQMQRHRHILESSHLGPRIKRESEAKLSEWKEQYRTAVENINELYRSYYATNLEVKKLKIDFFL